MQKYTILYHYLKYGPPKLESNFFVVLKIIFIVYFTDAIASSKKRLHIHLFYHIVPPLCDFISFITAVLIFFSFRSHTSRHLFHRVYLGPNSILQQYTLSFAGIRNMDLTSTRSMPYQMSYQGLDGTQFFFVNIED